jgi:hypothetical protein
MRRSPPVHPRFSRAAAIAAAVLLAAPAAAAAAPADAARSHGPQARVTGSMLIFDDDDWSSDESGSFDFDEVRAVRRWRASRVNVARCVDEEVRAELHVTLSRGDRPRWLDARIDARLYEEDSCDTRELHDHVAFHVTIPPRRSRTWDFRLRNVDEGGDYADFSFKISNSG